MFKGYLKEHPLFFQLAVFLGSWSMLQLITFTLLPIITQRIFGYDNLTEAFASMDTHSINVKLFANAFSAILTFLLPALIFVYVSDAKPLRYLGLKQLSTNNTISSVLLGVGLVLVIPFLGNILSQFNWGTKATEMHERAQAMNQLFFSDKSLTGLMKNLLVMAIIPGLCEEIFFRGIVQRFVNSWTAKPWLSIMITSLFFALIHLSYINFIPIFIASIILGFIYHKTGNLWISIFTHMVYNGSQVILNWVNPDAENQLTIFGILSVLGVIILFFLLKNLFNKNQALPSNWTFYYPKGNSTHIDQYFK